MSPVHPKTGCTDFTDTRFGQMPAEACTEKGVDPGHAGCGPQGKGLGPMTWLLIGVLGTVSVLGIAHFAARFI